MTKKEFIEYIAEIVVRTPSEFFNSVTIAQACLESGFGTSVLYKAFNNSFGYKAKEGEWDGDIAGDYKSDEEINGVEIKDVPSDFRAYKNIEESVKDHAYMMSRTSSYAAIYKDAINAKTPEAQAKALTGTYAGDSKYYDKLMNIINTYGLKKYDTGQKITNPQPKSNQSSEDQSKENDNKMAKLRTPIKKHTLVNMGGRMGKVEYIVIHFVGARGQAADNANYFYNVYREASAQLFIDPNVTYEVVPENRVAWHVGDGRGKYGITNSNSIGKLISMPI